MNAYAKQTTLRVLAILWILAAPPAFGQTSSSAKVLITGRDSRLYLVDFSAGTAAALLAISPDKAVFPSPDLSYVITSDDASLKLYRISGGALQESNTILEKGISSVLWAPDSTSFVYAVNVVNPDKTVSVQIFQWSIATAQAKRLL